MPRDRSNRIEVDLKLLQDKNVEKLQEFGKQFEQSIDKLSTMLGSYAEQVSGAMGTVERAGKIGPDASRADDVRITGPAANARMGGVSTGGFGAGMLNAPPSGGSYGGGGGPSMAPGGLGGGPLGVGGSGSFEQQYVRAQKRIGEIPVGLRQALGYIAEGAPVTDSDGYVLDKFGNRDTDENGNIYKDNTLLTRTGARSLAATANEWMFRKQAVQANLMLGYGHVQNFYGANLGRIGLGQQLGSSREGGVFGIFSNAWWQGLRENLHTRMASDFGFSPYYSNAQAQAARQALQQFGYSGHTSDYLAGSLKELQIHQGIDPSAAMAILDPLMRFGGDENMGQLLTVLRQIPDAAKAAHMNLSEFTQQLISTSQEVAQGTGMTVGGAARALSAFTTTTGLSPSRAAGLFSNPQNLMLAAGLTGQSVTSLMEGRNRMAPRMAFGLRMFQGYTGGYSAAQLADLRKSNVKKYDSIMNGAWLAYANNNEIFGGFSPRELINAQVRNQGHLLQHTAIDEQIQSASSVNRIEQMLRGWGGVAGKHMSSEFETYLSKNPNVTVAQARQEALDLISRSQNSAQSRAARQITKIDMTPETKKFFKILNYDDTPHRSSKNWFERNAMPAVGSALHAGESMLTHGLLGG